MGGNAVPGVGKIHLTEIDPTLRSIEHNLKLKEDYLNDRLLGSVGKKEYSGDIDIVMDPMPAEEFQKFFYLARLVYGINNVKKSGNMVNVAVPIVSYNEALHDDVLRTGAVQVDFIFADYKYTKLFYHSAGDKSKYKGVHRNIAISAVAGFIDRIESSIVDDQGRPVEKIRWKWSPNGFFKIRRFSRKDEHGNWLKTQKDQPISKCLDDPELVAKKLFGDNATVSDLDSFESVLDSIKRVFDVYTQQKMFKLIAQNLEEYSGRSKNTRLLDFEFPSEISQFMNKNDK